LRLSERLLTAKRPADLPVLVFAGAGGGAYEQSKAELDRLGDLIRAHGFEQSPTLTIVFGVIDAGDAPRFSVVSANGLAG
jgi:hypothetical protein